MYYEIKKNKISDIKFENISPNNLCIAYIDLIELERIYEKLNLNKQTIVECNSNKYSKSNFEIYEDYYFAIIDIKSIEDINREYGKLGIILKNKLIVIININKGRKKEIDNIICNILKHIKGNATYEQLISLFINTLIDGYYEKLEYLENKIISIEKELLKKEISSSLHILIFSIKKELSLYKRYFENLINFIQNIKNIDNSIFNTQTLIYLNNSENKIIRLSDTTQYLIENTVHLREVYQSALDFYQNKIIKILTVITIIFLPLSLIAGWYGMNFKYMPEISSKCGYPTVIISSILIIIICLIFFKRKNIL